MALAALGALACERRERALPWVQQGDVILEKTQRTGVIDAPALEEGSGIVASARIPGLLWALNDSGNETDLFALTLDGHVRGVVRVTGVRNRDWEALGYGPCARGTCLYIGDVGDNEARRKTVQVHRLGEPAAPSGLAEAAPPQTISVRFPDEPHDVEAMYVAPDTSLWLITKRPARRPDGTDRPVRLFRVPASAWHDSAATVLSLIDSLPIIPVKGARGRDWVTDASLSAPDATGGRRLAVLTYGAVYIFPADPATGRPGTLLARCALPIRETTTEGITWLADGRLLLLSEGKGAPLFAGKCP